jgi:TusA-related sulfurtransferase
MRVIDLRGLPCPEPLMAFVKSAYVMDPGEAKVLVVNPVCFSLIAAYAHKLDCEVIKTRVDGDIYEIVVRKADGKKKDILPYDES